MKPGMINTGKCGRRRWRCRGVLTCLCLLSCRDREVEETKLDAASMTVSHASVIPESISMVIVYCAWKQVALTHLCCVN